MTLRTGVVTFFVVAAGAVGCVAGGYLGDRVGRCKVCAWMLAVSCVCGLVVGRTRQHFWLLVLVGVIWGVASVGDSAQYSTMVTEVTEAEAVVRNRPLDLCTCSGLHSLCISLTHAEAHAERVLGGRARR